MLETIDYEPQRNYIKEDLTQLKHKVKDKEILKQEDPINFIKKLKGYVTKLEGYTTNIKLEKLSDGKIKIGGVVFDKINMIYSKELKRPRFADCQLNGQLFRLRFFTNFQTKQISCFWTDSNGNTYQEDKGILKIKNSKLPDNYLEDKELLAKYTKYQKKILLNSRNFINSPYDTGSDGIAGSALRERELSGKKDPGKKIAKTQGFGELDEEPLTCIDLIYRSLVETFGVDKLGKNFDENTYQTPRYESKDGNSDNRIWVENGNKENGYYMLRWVNSREKHIIPGNENFEMYPYSTMKDKRLYVGDLITSGTFGGRRHIAIVTEVDDKGNATKIIHSYKGKTGVIESTNYMKITNVIRPSKELIKKIDN